MFSSRGRLNELRRQQVANSRKLTKLHPEMLLPTEAVKTPGDTAKRQGKGTSSPLLVNKSSARQVADRSTSQVEADRGRPVRCVKFEKQPEEESILCIP